MTTDVPGRHAGSGATLLAMLIAVASVAAAAVAAGVTGNFGIPHNDDWSFSLTALDLIRTGHLHYFNWGQMPLLGQIAASLPATAAFGDKETSLQITGLVLAACVLILAFALARQLVDPWLAALTTLAIAAFPGFGSLAASYMTDLPALAGQLGCLLAGAAAIRRRNAAWLVASAVLAVWAVSIRQQSLLAYVAVAVVALIARPDRRFRNWVLLVTAGTLAACAAIEVVRRTAPGAQTIPVTPTSVADIGHVVTSITELLFTLGLLVSPIVMLRLGRVFASRADRGRQAGWALGLAAVLAYVAEPATGHAYQLTAGNYLARTTSFALQTQGIPASMPMWLWVVVQLAAGIGGIVILGELAAAIWHIRTTAARIRDGDPARSAVAIFAVLYAVILIVQGLPGQHLYDRYTLPLVVPAVLLLDSMPRIDADSPGVRPGFAVAAFCTAALTGIVSWTLTVATMTSDHAVWQAALAAERTNHLAADEINAGLAWDGWAAREPADRARIRSGPPAYPTAEYTEQFRGSRDCAVIVAGTDNSPSLRLQRTTAIRGYGLPGESAEVRIYLNTGDSACPGSVTTAGGS